MLTTFIFTLSLYVSFFILRTVRSLKNDESINICLSKTFFKSCVFYFSNGNSQFGFFRLWGFVFSVFPRLFSTLSECWYSFFIFTKFYFYSWSKKNLKANIFNILRSSGTSHLWRPEVSSTSMSWVKTWAFGFLYLRV